jgi:imidazolonepropionase-like amidohydrolase
MQFRPWLIVCAAATACGAPPPAAPSASPPQIALIGATVIAGPDAAPIEDGVVVIAGDRITAVGPRSAVAVPAGARRVDSRGATILAGFWNTHVHFLQPTWVDAAHAPAARLEEGLRELATRWGFVHVVDTGSNLPDTVALRSRIERGELRGPSIRTAGPAFVAVGGQPMYIETPLPQLATAEQGRGAATEVLDGGADLVKLMTASVVARPPPPVMPLEVVTAVAEVAHARGALVVAHPTNREGVEVARAGGVDILAHTAPAAGPWTAAEAAALVAARVSLIPTVSLWRPEIEPHAPAIADEYERVALAQVRTFADAGGSILFGTDSGYRPELDPSREHELLARAGLSFAARLAMLTTAPAARFGAERTGRVAVGFDADVVVLDGDPRVDPRAFARVRCSLRRGVVVFGEACAAPAAR